MELPGRGARSNEKLCDNIEMIVNDIFEQALNYIEGDYAIYGHSMGGLLAYLLTKKILCQNLSPPLHLFITGATAPSANRNHKVHLLDKQAFVDKIRSYRGMPDDVIDDETVMNYFEPILRSDFKASENFLYTETPAFNIPITIIIGDRDYTELTDIEAWRKETTAEVKIMVLPGYHFFIFEYAEFLMKLIENTVKQTINEKRPVF